VKEWFLQWLGQEHPELVDKYRALYPGRDAYAPLEYRRWLSARIRPLMRAHGLERGEEDPATGSVKSSALGSLGTLRTLGGERRSLQHDGLLVGELGPERAAILPGVGQPTLF
jgi:hypothetical protein